MRQLQLLGTVYNMVQYVFDGLGNRMKALRLLALLIVPMGMLGQGASQGGTEARMESLKSLLKSGTVKHVQVLHMPDSTLTRIAVTPQVLRSIARTSKTFNERIESTFDPLLSGVSVKSESHSPDLRWAVLFYDAQNREVASVFVDKFGKYGYLSGETVSFDTGLLGANFAKRLRKLIDDSR